MVALMKTKLKNTKEVRMKNIYINKKQLSTISLSLMSFTRDTDIFDFAIKSGLIESEDAYLFVDTLKRMIEAIDNGNGALLVTEIDMDNLESCVDLWGNDIDSNND